MVERGQPFKSESDFLFECYSVRKNWTGTLGRIYPKVSSIPKSVRIAPDIDLLEVKSIGQEDCIIGYEIKFLREKDPYQSFYTGLGETLCYFKHGIEKAYLILGFFNTDRETFKRVQTNIRLTTVFLAKQGLRLLDYLQVLQIGDSDNLHNHLSGVHDPRNKFPTSSDREATHIRDCIIRNQFEWGKIWLKNRLKSSK